MQEVLDSEQATTQEPGQGIFSWKALQLVCLLERLLLVLIVMTRVDLIHGILSIGALRGLINLVNYETGWTFVVAGLLLLVNQAILKGNTEKQYWAIKLSGYLGLIFLLEMAYWSYSIFLVLLIVYYLQGSVANRFGLLGEEKKRYTWYSISGLVLIICLDMSCFFLDY